MKLSWLRRVLVAGLLLVIIGLGLVAALVGTRVGQRRVEQWVREQHRQNSALVLAPFEVQISPWRDFPHLTASLLHLRLTDTAYQQPMTVLSIARTDMRLSLRELLRGQVHVTRLVINDAVLHERVDSLGRSWSVGRKGKRQPGPGRAPRMNLKLDALTINNFRIVTRNDFTGGLFAAHVRQARLKAYMQQGVLRIDGTLDGELGRLGSTTEPLFEREPMQAWVNYRYKFRERQGYIYRTRATLNGDTVQISGTHTVVPGQPGTQLSFRFVGTQPLPDVLRLALPQSLRPIVEGATSPSKAYIRYTIRGLSGPTIRPRNILRFALRDAQLTWPDTTRHIKNWDLSGTYDNGPGHNLKTTTLTLPQCRIHTAPGWVDISLTIRDFTRPFLTGQIIGRTELPELAAVVAPELLRARRGTAELDLQLRGPLPPQSDGTRPIYPDSLSVRGNVTLRDASFVLLDRGANFSGVNVRVGLQDSRWHLTNAIGVLDGMRFRATATTDHLLDYLTKRHPTTDITGNFAVDEVRIDRLRELLRPVAPGAARTAAPVPAKSGKLDMSMFPPGLHLNVGLRCDRLLLPADTVNRLAVTVRHDGHRVQLHNIRGQVWGADVSGRASWPSDTSQQVAPIRFELAVKYDQLNYQNLVRHAARPPQRSAKEPASPALRELLLAANGHVTCTIDAMQLSAGENIRDLRLRLEKTGSSLRMPYLNFATTRGGIGKATATVQVAGTRVLAANATLDLRYATLDVQQLLQMLAGLDVKEENAPQSAQNGSRRKRPAATANGSPRDKSLLSNGILSAVVRVQADKVQYTAVRGTQFKLVSRLREGEALLEECSLNALGGQIKLRGRMLTNAGQNHHPLHVQTQLEGIALPELFTTLTDMNINLLDGHNVRGTLRCAADLHTDLDSTFLPVFDTTLGYLKTDIRDLELLNVDFFTESLKFMKTERTSHLFFEPVSTQLLLHDGRILIPSLRLNSNLSNLEVSGYYHLDGRANLYVSLNPLQVLFGNNQKRVERIQQGRLIRSARGRPTYVNLRRPAAKSPYKVRLFKKAEQREQQELLRQQARQLLLTQPLDTTLRLLRP
ncbi:AsmA family protein [Hymenobacter radiodurans]|uniref:AsmA-like C-terminal region-containing protein n=1 Tax=Hymenobacter radiodurans TaxID=2496028 RepID=UPI0010589D39|nr:AsmA-like C-terminal region-containing protein [Hymenobacter radiodurans]